MGCCISRPVPSAGSASGADTETQQLRTSTVASPRAHVPPPPPPPPLPPPSSPSRQHRHHHPHLQHPPHPPIPLSDRYNHALVRKPPWSSKRAVTSAALQRARNEFWDTRVTGRPEIWGALRAATEMLQMDLSTAQGIVDAAGITVPTGDLSRGVYDESGHRYEIPEYCFSDPVNVSTAVVERGRMDEEDEESEEDDAAGDLGKGKMRVGREVLLKARLSDRGGPDVAIKVDEAATVRRITVLVEGKAQLPATQRISLMYLGRILEENKTLAAQGWKRGDVVNALVRSR
ncbi:putative ubiquitin domain protein [Tricharina praecox]|uniref:putative ubiquitin domain protein n=1 Tax=Tricharina praecox TaxID=43433 RepID=UPI0022204FD2|nr:putative ubiquitin domain protein [Tricharina praecox]KAI5855668.1 putative ubiquitin domain protein [Tricharina praecox]